MSKLSQSLNNIQTRILSFFSLTFTKTLLKFISVILLLYGVFRAALILFNVFLYTHFFSLIYFVYVFLLIGSSYFAYMTSIQLSNPQKDRIYSFLFLGFILSYVLIFSCEKIIFTAFGVTKMELKSIFEELQISINFTTFFVFFVIFDVLISICTLCCCCSYFFIGLINGKHIASEMDAPYRMVKTEDEDSDIVFDEKELEENNEPVIKKE